MVLCLDSLMFLTSIIYVAGHVNVAPRHLTAEAETLLSATLIHEVMHVLGFDPHAFAHFRDERKRRRSQVQFLPSFIFCFFFFCLEVITISCNDNFLLWCR
jgi:Leishmanolysin